MLGVCPFIGVTNSGRVWRKVPERDALSVTPYAIAAGHAVPEPSHLVSACGSSSSSSSSSSRATEQQQ